MVSNVFMGPGSWASNRELKRRNRYVNLYHPGDVFVNHLEVERKEAEKRAKLAKKEEALAAREARKAEIQAARKARKEEAIAIKEAKKEAAAKRRLQKEAIDIPLEETSAIDKICNFAKGIFGALAANTVKESDVAFIESLDESACEIDIEKRDEMIQALKEGRYEDFRNSEFAKMPLEDIELLFDFDGYEYIHEPEKISAKEATRVIGKPANIRKNKSLTLNYLRKETEIEIKKLLQYMQDEEFGTVYPNSAENLLEWANYKDGIEASPHRTSDVRHNWHLTDLKTEIRSAYDSLHAPKTNEEKILIFPNGEKCGMSTFLRDF